MGKLAGSVNLVQNSTKKAFYHLRSLIHLKSPVIFLTTEEDVRATVGSPSEIRVSRWWNHSTVINGGMHTPTALTLSVINRWFTYCDAALFYKVPQA